MTKNSPSGLTGASSSSSWEPETGAAPDAAAAAVDTSAAAVDTSIALPVEQDQSRRMTRTIRWGKKMSHEIYSAQASILVTSAGFFKEPFKFVFDPFNAAR